MILDGWIVGFGGGRETRTITTQSIAPLLLMWLLRMIVVVMNIGVGIASGQEGVRGQMLLLAIGTCSAAEPAFEAMRKEDPTELLNFINIKCKICEIQNSHF